MVEIATITQQAQAMSAQNGQSPEQNAYAILKNAYGMTNAQMDSLWGFAPGSVDAVFGPQNSAGVGVAGNTTVTPASAFNSSGMTPTWGQNSLGEPIQTGWAQQLPDGGVQNYSLSGAPQGAPSYYKGSDGSFGGMVSSMIKDPNFQKAALLTGGALYGLGAFDTVPIGESLGVGGGEALLGPEAGAVTVGGGLVSPGATAAGTAAATGAGTVAGTTAGTAAATGAGTLLSQIPGASSLPTWLQQLLPGLLTGAGGIIAGNSAVDAAKTQADAQVKAAQIAADAAKFKPVGVTTGFGSSQFGYDKNGNLTSAGYQLTPQMQALRNQTMGSLGGLLNQAQSAQAAAAPLGTAAQQAIANGQNLMGVGGNVLNQAQQFFYDPKAIQAATYPMAQAGQQAVSLGQGYLSTDPQAQAAKYYADQMRLLEPTRAADMAALQAQMQAQGRGGFAIGGGVGGQGAANPQLQALLNAQMQQNNQLAASATQGGMDYAKFGTGMVGAGGDLMQGMFNVQNAAYQPYNNLMSTAQNALSGGANLAGSGANLLTGMYNAETAAYNPFKTALGTAQTIEGLGQDALTQGINLGNTTTAANARAGLLSSQGVQNAASTMAQANAYSPWGAALTNMGTSLSGYKFDPLTGKAL